MITNATQLEGALEHLATLQRMQEAMRLHLQETDPAFFPTVSEGYSRRIEDLQGEIFGYLRERPAESPVSVRLSGPLMKPGVVRANLVGNLIIGLQSALYQIGRLTSTEGLEGDEIQVVKGLRSLFALNLIATAPGSFILAMDLAPRQQLNLFDEYDAASAAVERLIGYVNELEENPEIYTGDVPTLRGLRKVASLVKKDVEAIEILYRDRGHRAGAVFNSVVRERIEYLLGAPAEGEKTVRGQLIEINVENNTCKIHPAGESAVDCAYEEDLEDDLIDAIKQEISMAGQFVETGRAGRYRITKIERFRVLDDEDIDAD